MGTVAAEAQESTTTFTDYDVIIAGAGMVGAAIGCALGQAGMRVALFDPALPEAFDSNSQPDIRVSALSPASISFLDKLGAWSAIKDMRTCPYRRMAVWEKLHDPLSGKLVTSRFNQTMFDCKEVGTEELGFIVENRVTQLALHAVLKNIPNIELIAPAKPASVNMAGEYAVVTLDNGTSLRAKLLVGADGANSFVRRSCNIGLASEDYEQRALVATVEIPEGPLDITWQAFTATGPLALLPLPECGGKHYASLVWYNLPENINRLMSLSGAEFLDDVRSHFPEELPEMHSLIERGFFPLTRRHASTYIKEKVVLVGDAAHTINPLAGQGVNLGFQDAATLSETVIEAYKAGEAFGSHSVLAGYEKKRRPENTQMQKVMDVFYHLFSNDNMPLKVARNIGLTLAGNFPYGRKKVMRYAMGLEKPITWPFQ
ncbi:UbiH/UbiF/VisC/COQ6 family ubiquinone biosynthesis hydroxylase [Parendozoicomonas haliclonae]|uniref:2-octaprenyl-3-methyl-6-methoxy-1,4-benzoquinol hydroxylase n=1 Tax=Parendozoicomonas haliclonae TaxID=1960125 RepID=A0A1X7AJN4_9GAMM|nr:UbiH/UbiF/VisC/COQ6 family ubiquinone biosynthesis hydroxylase [Parendozoicomonas haliclonae]SMA46749.1 2-octaprenyl-3-methyl-6-methoxy-1,4-benzoquinol hydroxylase [Parendozoicomonas haliclonae]